MKPFVPALGLLAALTPMLAHADQDTAVKLYGRIDVAVEATRFSGTPTKQPTSPVALSTDTSYWGLTGSEALGGGTRAYFKLESGFNVDTGTAASPTSLFNREAYVALGSDRYGSIQVGNQFTPAFFITTKADPFQRSSNGAIMNLMQQGAGNKQRGYRLGQGNSVQYLSPSFGGVSARAMVGLSERTSAPDDLGAFRAASVEYAAGPVFAGLSVEEEKVAGTAPNSSIAKKTYTLGATYDFGVTKVYGYLLRNTLENARDANAYMVGLSYPIGAGTIRSSYTAYKLSDTPGAKANVIALGYTYVLSKRTTLYTSYAHLGNGAASNFALWPGSKTYGLPSLDENVRSLEFGIRHFF
jgi:predicted porin